MRFVVAKSWWVDVSEPVLFLAILSRLYGSVCTGYVV